MAFDQSDRYCTYDDAVTPAELFDLASWQTLAQQAVDAACAAGAHYAEARLTRVVLHESTLSDD